jgi:two-component system NtrC family sensor kinase
LKLAGKLVLSFLAGAVILLVIDGVLAAHRERQLFEQDAEMDARLLGRAMQTVVTDAWRRHGEGEALRLIEEVGRQRPLFAIRWVWLDGGSGEEAPPGLSPRDLARLGEGREVVVRSRVGSEKLLMAYFPVHPAAGRSGALELVESLAPVAGATRSAVGRIGLLTLGLSLLAILLAVPYGMRVVGRPLRSLVEKTRRIGRNDFSDPLRLSGHDELTELASSLNAMCDQLAESRTRLLQETRARIAALEQLRHEDRLRTVGRLASGLAHELGTPLNVVQGRAGMIAGGRLSEEEAVAAAEIIKAQAQGMTGIVRQLLDFSRRQAPNRTEIRPAEIAREVVDLLRPMARKKGAVLRVSGSSDVGRVQADASQIRQVLTNLVMNALQAVESRGTVEIGLSRRRTVPPDGLPAEAGEYLCFVVEDDGEGVAEEHLPHLFEPFFTTKDLGRGTGLGLAIVHGIVREHGGWIDVISRPGEGSRFTVFIPLGEGE